MSIEPQEEVEEILEEATEVVEPEEVEEEPAEEVEEEATEEVKEEPAEEVKPKKKKTMEERQAALKKSTWEMRESERKNNESAARVSEQADRVEKALRALEDKQAATEYTAARPISDNFPVYEDYQDAVMDWKIKGASKPEVKPGPTQQQTGPVKDYTSWQESREDAIETQADYEKNEGKLHNALKSRVDNSASPELYNKQVAEVQQITDIIIDSKVGTKLVQYLGRNPEKMREISRLSPIKAAGELREIEIEISRPPKKKSTTAPKPVSKVIGTGGAADNKAKNTADWMAQRNEEVMKKRKG